MSSSQSLAEPAWVVEGRKHLGLREIPGKEHAPTITRWLRDLRAWWADDETAWCGTFVAAMLRGRPTPLPRHWYRARSWLEYGVALEAPCVGCIAVFERGGGGHVGFVVGTDEKGRLMVLGGNQGNAVSVAPFDKNRALGYRYPAEKLLASALPVLASNGAKSSRNEA